MYLALKEMLVACVSFELRRFFSHILKNMAARLQLSCVSSFVRLLYIQEMAGIFVYGTAYPINKQYSRKVEMNMGMNE